MRATHQTKSNFTVLTNYTKTLIFQHMGRSSSIKRSTQDGAFTVRDARSGAFLMVAESRFPMPNTSEIGKALAVDRNGLNRVLNALGSVTKRSRDASTSLQLTIQVDPDGESRIVQAPHQVPLHVKGEGGARVAKVRAGLDQAAATPELSRAFDAAYARGRSRAAEILAGPEILSAEAFAEHLGTTRATINAWRNQRRVIGLDGPTRGYKYPAWQIDDNGRPFDALPALFEMLGDSPWAVYRFMVQRHGELGGRTGIEALRKGGDVLDAARSVAEAYA